MSNVPMSNSDLALAVIDEKFGHSSTYVELEDESILHGHGLHWRTSSDGGLTWSETFRFSDTDGEPVPTDSLVRLSGSGIGSACWCYYDKAEKRQGSGQIFFWRSEDNGKTWQQPIPVTPPGGSYGMLQDVMLRTSSGRIIIPAYVSFGQKVVAGEQSDLIKGSYYIDAQIPFPGGLYNNQWVTTDAHFTDPSFGACTVFYSDDDGKTWQQSQSGHLVINLEWGGPHAASFEPTVAEISPGRLLMFIRTGLGRLYQAWSYDNGDTWTRPQPSQLAADHSPAQLRTLPGSNHLLCVWSQHNEDEIRRGLVRVRLSSAISRTGGAVWEFFQNVESILEETYVPPGSIRHVRPENMYHVDGMASPVGDPSYMKPLPEGYGRWSYPSVFVYHDRVLIAHTYSKYDPQGNRCSGSRLKVLPIKWFYGDANPENDNPNMKNAFRPAMP